MKLQAFDISLYKMGNLLMLEPSKKIVSERIFL